MKKILVLFLGLAAAQPAYAVNTDELLYKAGQAAQSAARGDVQGAAYQAVPGYSAPLGRTHVYANAAQIGASQPLIPTQQIGNLPYWLSGNYNISVPVRPSLPKPNQNVNVGVHGKYFSNNTSFSPDRR